MDTYFRRVRRQLPSPGNVGDLTRLDNVGHVAALAELGDVERGRADLGVHFAAAVVVASGLAPLGGAISPLPTRAMSPALVSMTWRSARVGSARRKSSPERSLTRVQQGPGVLIVGHRWSLFQVEISSNRSRPPQGSTPIHGTLST